MSIKKLLVCITLLTTPCINATIFETVSRYIGITKNKEKETPKAVVAVLEIKGQISDARPHIDILLEAAKTPNVKALLIVIDSGGGLAGASENVSREVAKIAQTMPVIIWIENTCCSGAYLIASAGSKIIAPLMAHCGSIGTYSTMIKTFPETFNDGGLHGDVETYPTVAGNHKPHPNLPVTEEQCEHNQERSESIYRSFYQQVAQSRNLSVDEIESWADGKSFDGAKALEHGLIDEIGCFSDALDQARGFITKRSDETVDIEVHAFKSENTNNVGTRQFDFYL